MTRFNFSDIVLVKFKHTNGDLKKRPALVILDIGDDDIILTPVTSRERNRKGDYEIKDWKKPNLLRPSWARLAKPACLVKVDIGKKLGSLSSQDKNNIASVWKKTYNL